MEKVEPQSTVPEIPESTTESPLTGRQALALIIERWPKAFSAKSPRPLARGVHRIILRERPAGMSHRAVRWALGLYVSTNSYLKALTVPGAQRIDLTGAVVELVRVEDAVHATERLNKRVRLSYKKKKQKAVSAGGAGDSREIR